MNDKEAHELAEKLKSRFRYDPTTGVISRVSKGKSKVGSKSQGYLRIKIDDASYLAHRIAWFLHYGEWPKGEIDHINRVRDDNRICNLRDVSKSENQRNATRQHNNKSGVSGVGYSHEKRKWVARINCENKRKYLGSFECFGQAVSARRKAEQSNGYVGGRPINV
jgi:hypothetical protein